MRSGGRPRRAAVRTAGPPGRWTAVRTPGPFGVRVPVRIGPFSARAAVRVAGPSGGWTAVRVAGRRRGRPVRREVLAHRLGGLGRDG
ncbi:hypothetical protein PS9374_06215 [Planomonospora sphaerica]|uniref:Uncharacterized protein n=1 Tax=Planomonospora sphaerica TaxID=161355 RepID=A0A161LXX5_9ACTN|nr:hypothetical protein PS9374_06215 [Planomonospora sphaerica]